MKEYDVFIAGGGVAGSVAAKYLAKGGLKVLFIEKYRTPRKKACSGIQFMYFEKIIQEKIPKGRLCTNPLTKMHMEFPDGSKLGAPFKMLNFMRDTFDEWLNNVAVDNGAEFLDETEINDWKEVDDGVNITILKQKKDTEEIKAKYLIDATGLRPKIRMKMRPDDFEERSSGATINYYIDGDGDFDENKLYQFWNLDYNNMMFAWVYKKSDLWVVGTGYDKGISERGKAFYDFCAKKFNIKGEVVKKEGYSSTIEMFGENRVWLGEGRILMAGDSAGLVDITRGVGMDAAAISGRLVAKAILKAEKKGKEALPIYAKLMKKIVKQTMDNQGRGINRFKNNEELQAHFTKGYIIKKGMSMLVHSFFNKFRRPQNQKLLPDF